MARKRTSPNGHDRLEEALANLLQAQVAMSQNLTAMAQNQTALFARIAETDRAHAEFERRHLHFERETAERFSRLEAQMAEVIRVLNEHGRLLERLPEAIREKIGFKETGCSC